MKKILFILCTLFMQPAFAGNDLQMVLDKVHEQGFYGCDSAMPTLIKVYGSIQRVEAMLINEGIVDGVIANRPNRSASSIQVDVAEVSDNYSKIESYLIQKYQGKCYAKSISAVFSYPDLKCAQAIEANSLKILSKTGSFIWAKHKWGKNDDSSVILMNEGVAGCSYVYRDRGWMNFGKGIDMDQVQTK